MRAWRWGFLLAKARKKVFEVKRTSRINENMLRGLKAFLKEYPSPRAYFIYGGTRRFYDGKITILPIQEALLTLPDILMLLPAAKW